MSLKDLALKAYNEGKPILTDSEWDALFKNDGTDPLGSKGKIRLPRRMASLKKLFRGEDDLPYDIYTRYTETTKFDGCAVGIMYVDGALAFAATRGDGEFGADCTNKLKLVSNVPTSLPDNRTLWVTGELVAPKTIENSRNFVAGYLNSKSGYEDKVENIRFIAYDVHGYYENLYATYKEALLDLDPYFTTVANFSDADLYPTDGLVYRLNNTIEYYESGYTGNYKNGAFALKTRSEGVVTTLVDIVWQTGKSGKVTPVAILDPVAIGEAMVSRATLHNYSFIQELGLFKGARVKVERSGEIIPRIIGLVDG